MAAKAQQYLAAGVRLVWIDWTNRREVDEWRPGSTEPVAKRKGTDSLIAEDILPGFRYQVADLFA
jgi:Uma2 family endonuclease